MLLETLFETGHYHTVTPHREERNWVRLKLLHPDGNSMPEGKRKMGRKSRKHSLLGFDSKGGQNSGVNFYFAFMDTLVPDCGV